MVLLLLHQFLNMHFSNPGLQVINVLRVLTTYVVQPLTQQEPGGGIKHFLRIPVISLMHVPGG